MQFQNGAIQFLSFKLGLLIVVGGYAFPLPILAESRLSNAPIAVGSDPSSPVHELILNFKRHHSESSELKKTPTLGSYQKSNQTSDHLKKAIRSLNAKPSGTQLVDSDQGLMRLQFPSFRQMLKAQAELSKLGYGKSIQRNHIFRPAIHFRFQPKSEIQQASQSPQMVLWLDSILQLKLGPEMIAQLASNSYDSLPEVLLPESTLIEPPFSADPYGEKDLAYQMIHPPSDPQVEQSLKGKSPVTVALIDTGVDYNHEDLIEGLWRSPQDPRIVGRDVVGEHNRPFDVVQFDIEGCLQDFECSKFVNTSNFLINPGHGTHCAGHIAAVAGNLRGIRGVSLNAARVMSIKFTYGYGQGKAGSGDEIAAIAGIDYAIQNGAKIINISWAGRMSRVEAASSELKQALERARLAGILVIAAAGNDGINNDTDNLPTYPASFRLDNIISVAALDANGRLADFSSFGANSVHIAAPGVRVLSTVPGNNYANIVARYKDGMGADHEISWDGTSMATPIVAGAAAMIWAAHPEENYLQIKSRILKNVRPIAALQGRVFSGGILDVSRALP